MNSNNLSTLEKPDPIAQSTIPDQALTPVKTDWLSIGQFVFSTLAAVVLLGAAGVSTIILLLRGSLAELAPPGLPDLSPFLFTAGLGMIGILLIPSAVLSGRKLFSSRPALLINWDKLARLSYFFPVFILLGFALQKGPTWSRGWLSFVHILANGLAVLWLLTLGVRKLPRISAQRASGSLASGLALAPAITFTLELILLVGMGLLGMIFIQGTPGLREELLDLAVRWQNSAVSPAELESAVGRLASQPGVLAGLFFYLSILIPLVEELIKPLAVWPLLNRKLQPWEGYLVGAIAGAGFALFENLTIGAAVDIWTLMVILRTGTAAVHIYTAGLVGWGMASGILERKFGRSLGAFLAATLLHGVWNGLNILSGLSEFPLVRDTLGSFGSSLAAVSPVGLFLLALGSLLGLLKANSAFRRAIIAQEN